MAADRLAAEAMGTVPAPATGSSGQAVNASTGRSDAHLPGQGTRDAHNDAHNAAHIERSMVSKEGVWLAPVGRLEPRAVYWADLRGETTWGAPPTKTMPPISLRIWLGGSALSSHFVRSPCADVVARVVSDHHVRKLVR